MKRILTLFAFGLLLGKLVAQTMTAHGQVSQRIGQLRQSGVRFAATRLFQEQPRSVTADALWDRALDRAKVLQLDAPATTGLLSTRAEHLAFELPSEEGTMTLDLERVEITTPDFSVVAASSGAPVETPAAVHYRGVVRGIPGSLAAISVFGDEVMGLVSTADGDHVLGRLDNAPQGAHVFYRTDDLNATFTPTCGTLDDGEPYRPEELEIQGSPRTEKCVRLYWEVNYDIFQNKGSVTNAANHVTGIFNQSAILYANDGIDVTLSQVFVWDVPSPYTSTSTSTLLTQFGDHRTSFNGDLAHLIGYAGGGGIAWLNGVCNTNVRNRMAYSGISASYQNVPTYSWSVEVVTHETGHNLGSRHTHACVWNGNNTAIDGCGPAAGYSEGTCPQGPVPSSTVGGTIMSYCHLTSSTIKFANGFGPQPTAVMVNKINTAACLTACGTTCGTPSGLAASNITTTAATLTWAAASGATSYTLQWRPASVSTWTTVGNLTATSHSLANLTENTTYNFQVMATCASGNSAYAPMASFTTATTGTTCGVPNGLSAPELTTTSAVLLWNGVMDALSYDLQWKASSANTWTTVPQVTTTNHTLTGLTPGTAYQFKVMTNCTGATSAFSGNATFNTLEDGCTDSYEPNNALNQASVVGSGVTLYAKIANGSDQDHFKFGNAKKTKNIRVTLTDLPADFDIYLFRNNGEVASSTNVGSLGEEIVLNNANVSSNYRVRVVGKNGAFDASACYTLTIEVSGNTFSTQGTLYDGMVAGIEDPFAELVVYPNPASQLLNIQVPAVEGLVGVDLLDGTGRLVRNQQVTATDGAPTILSLDVLDLPQGLYFIRVTVGDANEVRRVVIAH